jgi:hypothetical protein
VVEQAFDQAALHQENESREGLRTLFGRRGKMNSGQKRADQQDQKVDLHVVLRCAVAANIPPQSKRRSTPAMTLA